ncbi:hypothetical protein N9L26_02515 [Candidatus Pacebacteria bacterium]|nr:hypothetical protein [Candidatus Paceibacterota bacterium]
MLSWALLIGLSVAGYFCISAFSHLTGGESQSYRELLRSLVKPIPLLLVIVGNVFLASAAYFGFIATNTAISIMLSIGILTSVVYSMLFLDVTVSVGKVVGILLILGGIFLLK